MVSFCSDSTTGALTDEVNLVLPQGFKAITILEQFGRNRHIVVNSNGDIYIKLERLKD